VAKTNEDRKFEAENDARTIAEGDVIKADSGRFTRAKTAATRLAKEAQARATAMKKVSGKKKK